MLPGGFSPIHHLCPFYLTDNVIHFQGLNSEPYEPYGDVFQTFLTPTKALNLLGEPRDPADSTNSNTTASPPFKPALPCCTLDSEWPYRQCSRKSFRFPQSSAPQRPSISSVLM